MGLKKRLEPEVKFALVLGVVSTLVFLSILSTLPLLTRYLVQEFRTIECYGVAVLQGRQGNLRESLSFLLHRCSQLEVQSNIFGGIIEES